MVTNPMNILFKQAVTTFTNRSEKFYSNLDVLKSLLDKITAEDVRLPSQFKQNNFWVQPHRAPVTYIDIYEDDVLSIGIFILKPGMKLPLHDHPEMHGLIKVIFGKIRLSTFSLNTANVLKFSEQLRDTVYPMDAIVEQNPDMIVDENAACCLLQPTIGNLHEIESVDGPAAFLDILAPPYDSLMPDKGPRKCTYFSIVAQLAPQIFKLKETASPKWFWNDTYPYTGPDLF